MHICTIPPWWVNPCTKFISGSIKTYSHISSFLNSEMAWIMDSLNVYLWQTRTPPLSFTTYPGLEIPMLQIRRSWDRLIFNRGIPIVVRRHLYIDTAPLVLSVQRARASTVMILTYLFWNIQVSATAWLTHLCLQHPKLTLNNSIHGGTASQITICMQNKRCIWRICCQTLHSLIHSWVGHMREPWLNYISKHLEINMVTKELTQYATK